MAKCLYFRQEDNRTAMRARVYVKLKPGVLDPQGKAIGNALTGLGFAGIGEVRQGKLIELDLAETDAVRARDQVEAMCRELLANPVIEDYTIELVALNGAGLQSM
jgi:phosphoribosylformylglycinamidine synthase PurS subunit